MFFSLIYGVISGIFYLALHPTNIGSFPPALSPSEETELIKKMEAGDKKAREKKITAKIHQARAYTPKTKKERVHKEDLTKEGLIKSLAEILPTLSATEVEIVNPSKLITFKLGADTFKLDLIRQRPKKEGK